MELTCQNDPARVVVNPRTTQVNTVGNEIDLLSAPLPSSTTPSHDCNANENKNDFDPFGLGNQMNPDH